jgi:hypothetical protein
MQHVSGRKAISAIYRSSIQNEAFGRLDHWRDRNLQSAPIKDEQRIKKTRSRLIKGPITSGKLDHWRDCNLLFKPIKDQQLIQKIRSRLINGPIIYPGLTHIQRERLRCSPGGTISLANAIGSVEMSLPVSTPPFRVKDLIGTVQWLVVRLDDWRKTIPGQIQSSSDLPPWVPPLPEELHRYLLDLRGDWQTSTWYSPLIVELKTAACLLDLGRGCLISRIRGLIK